MYRKSESELLVMSRVCTHTGCGINPFIQQSVPTDYEINLRADLNEYIGHEQIATFNYYNQEVLGKFPSTVKVETNKEMKLFFDLNQNSIFDKKTNNRI